MTYTPYHSPWQDFPDLSTPIIAAALDHIEAGIASASVGGGNPLYINVMDYGADNTGADFNDVAFAAAFAAAVSGGLPYPMVSGPGGTYKFGSYSSLSGGTIKGPSLALPPGIQLGGFGGGAYGCATLSFPETLLPTAIARAGNTTPGATTLSLTNCKNAFAPASVTYPQWVQVPGFGTFTYTGITGSGLTPTLTGISPVLPAGDAVGSLVAGNASVMLSSGTANKIELDHTIQVSGPFTGSRDLWCPCGTLNGSVASNAATIAVTAVAGTFPATGQVMIVGNDGCYCITYTGYTGGNLTGCTTHNDTATLPSGASVFYITPPTAVDGIFMGSGSVDCQVGGFRHGTLTTADHNHWGPNFHASDNYSHICLESPSGVNWAGVDSGNHHFQSPMKWEGAYWANLYITAGNAILASWFDGRQQSGYAPWWCWKEATVGVTGAATGIMDENTYVYHVMQENGGLGFIGCPDGGSTCYATFVGCIIGIHGSTSPGHLPVVAEFACDMSNFRIFGDSMTNGDSGTAYPFIFGSVGVGMIDVNPKLLHPFVQRPVLGRCRAGSTATYKILFPGGMIVGGQNSNVTAGTVCACRGSADEGNWPGVSLFDRDSGPAGAAAPGGIAPVAFSSNSDSPSRDVGVVLTSQQWGQIRVKCRSGVITSGDIVRSDGTADPGYAKRWTAGDDAADGPIIGVAQTSESGGFATILISPAFS